VSAGTWAVVVARADATAKTRLAPVLGPAERAALARAMLSDVLAACAGAGLAGTAAVVSAADGPPPAPVGVLVVPDPGGGMNAAVRAGVLAAADAGAEAVLVLPGDVPLARPGDLRAVVAAADGLRRALVVVPDHAGTGTNALLLRPPDLVTTAFGAGSAVRHLAAGAAAGAAVRRLPVPSLANDVDTPSDLAALRSLDQPGATRLALSQLTAPI
jgi:2-phospho-L-lactate guanylyltransferase